MRYRLLCLDAGFTLLSPRRTLADALSGVLGEHGHAPTDAELRRAWEAADRWFWEEYHQPDNRTWTDDALIHEIWRRYHDRMLGELGIDGDEAMLERILASQFAPDGWEAYPDVGPLFETLAPERAAGRLRVGVVSDWGSSLREIFEALDLEGRLDFILASATVGLAKPDPAFFRLALDEAGLSEPSAAIMVGDSLRADVEGARAAGMDAVLLDRAGEAGPSPVPVIRSLDELPDLLIRDTDAAHAEPALTSDGDG